MKRVLIAVGELKSGVECELFQHYQKRITPSLTVIEIKQKSIPETEEKEILKHLHPGDFICVLDERGENISSRHLSDALKTAEINHKRVVFIIGGADGLTDHIRSKAHQILSFGQLTWPHMLVRGMLAEQIYRCQQIQINHPYHRD